MMACPGPTRVSPRPWVWDPDCRRARRLATPLTGRLREERELFLLQAAQDVAPTYTDVF